MLNVILLEHAIQAIILDIQQFKMCRNQINNRYDHMDIFSGDCTRSEGFV